MLFCYTSWQSRNTLKQIMFCTTRKLGQFPYGRGGWNLVEIQKFGRHPRICQKSWKLVQILKFLNLVKVLKFGWNSEIWLKSWNLVKILKFGQNPEICLKFWNLVKMLKFGWNPVKILKFAQNPETWPPEGATCIATLPWIALLSLSASIELVSSSARVTSVKSAKGVVSEFVS